MLQSYLIQQKGSLVVPYNYPLDLTPSFHQFQKPCCLPSQPAQSQLPSIKEIPVSPRHRRIKIFQEEKKEPIIKNSFEELAIEESKVESYKAPSVLEQKSEVYHSPQRLVVKKAKVKTTKQNVLCFKKSPRSQQTIPSTLKQISSQPNHPITKGKNKKGLSLSNQEEVDLFTFSSEMPLDSMRYSNSKGWMGGNIESRYRNDP